MVSAMLALPITPTIIGTTNNQLPLINNKIKAATTNNLNPNNIDSLTETLHQPFYHLETDQGWSNDLQSIVFNSNSYDLYFLHSQDGATNPFGPSGQDWHHINVKDAAGPYNSKQNVAIESHGPKRIDDTWKSAWTGSVIKNQGNIQGVPNGAKVAYFSGLNAKDGSQNIYAAWSSDNGNTFSHPLNNGHPILRYNQSGASGKADQERDSFVTYNNGKLLMYCAEGNQLGVYTSQDGTNWTKADPNGKSKVMPYTFFNGRAWDDNQDSPIECPQLITLKNRNNGVVKTILFYGCKDPQNKETTGTYYVIGHLDSNGLFAADTPAQRFDLGPDYYGSNIMTQDDLNDPMQSDYGMGWIGNWNYTSQGVHNSQDGTGVYTGRLGSYSLPRYFELNKDNTALEFKAMDLNDMSLSGLTEYCNDNASTTLPLINGQENDNSDNIVHVNNDDNTGLIAQFDKLPVAAEIKLQLIDFDKDWSSPEYKNNLIHFDFTQGKDYVDLTYNPTTGDYHVTERATELDNDLSGTKASSYYYDGTSGNGQGYSGCDGPLKDYLNLKDNNDRMIEIYTDKDSIEIQFPSNKVFTIARFATNDTQQFKMYVSGDLKNQDNVDDTPFISTQIKTYKGQSMNTPDANPTDNAKPTISNNNSTKSSTSTNDSSTKSSINTTKNSSVSTNTKDNSASTSTKNSSASTNMKGNSTSTSTKDSSASTNAKDSSASTNTKDSSASTNIKDSSASINVKDNSASTNTKDDSANTNIKDNLTNAKSSSASTNNDQIKKLPDNENINGNKINYIDSKGKNVKSVNIPGQTNVSEIKANSPFNKNKTNNATINKQNGNINVQLAKTNDTNNHSILAITLSALTIGIALLGAKLVRKNK